MKKLHLVASGRTNLSLENQTIGVTVNITKVPEYSYMFKALPNREHVVVVKAESCGTTGQPTVFKGKCITPVQGKRFSYSVLRRKQ